MESKEESVETVMASAKTLTGNGLEGWNGWDSLRKNVVCAQAGSQNRDIRRQEISAIAERTTQI